MKTAWNEKLFLTLLAVGAMFAAGFLALQVMALVSLLSQL